MNSPAKSGTPQAGEISVRHCHGLAEFGEGFALMQSVWGKTELDVPIPLFVVAAETGGQVLGAFNGEQMVGFTMAIAGWRDARPLLHSHMTAVLESHRDRGIGRRLKMFQRDDALARGIHLVEWTFDPLITKNAYFNFMRLGAIARRYIPNCYGVTTSPLHSGLPTDRLMAEWHLDSPRVKETLAASRGAAPLAAIPARAEIFVPADLSHLQHDAPVEVLRIQTEIREKFQRWFAEGFAATALETGNDGARYILEPWGKSAGGAGKQ
jgi:predicted GNAT superfamily acetyltransferase